MDSETKKFLRDRKIGAFLPWIGIVGMLVLTFSPIFGGFPLLFTELGYVANFYFFIDEYNWLAQHLLINSDHSINQANKKIIKPILVFFIILTIIVTIVVSILREQNIFNFVAGVSFLYVIYFAQHDFELLLIMLKKDLHQKSSYLIWFVTTLLLVILLSAVYFFVNKLLALYLLISLGIIQVVEKDIVKEMKLHDQKIQWEDDNDNDRFSQH